MRNTARYALGVLLGLLWIAGSSVIAVPVYSYVDAATGQRQEIYSMDKSGFAKSVHKANSLFETGIQARTAGNIPVRSLERTYGGHSGMPVAICRHLPQTAGYYALSFNDHKTQSVCVTGRSADYYILALRRLII